LTELDGGVRGGVVEYWTRVEFLVCFIFHVDGSHCRLLSARCAGEVKLFTPPHMTLYIPAKCQNFPAGSVQVAEEEKVAGN
jgi:hypothetical protein